MWQELLDRLGVEYGFHIGIKRRGTRNPGRIAAPELSARLRPGLFGRRHGCGRRILAIKVVNESPRDVDAVGSVNQRYLAAID